MLYKILATLTKIRLEPFVEVQIALYLAGCRKGRAITDPIYKKKVLITYYEYKIAAIIIFADFRKALHPIKRRKITK